MIEPLGSCASSPASTRPNGRRRPICSRSSRPQWSRRIPIKVGTPTRSSRLGGNTSKPDGGCDKGPAMKTITLAASDHALGHGRVRELQRHRRVRSSTGVFCRAASGAGRRGRTSASCRHDRRPVVASRPDRGWAGVDAAPDTARDLDEVELHRLSVGSRAGERRAGAARRARHRTGMRLRSADRPAGVDAAAPRPLPHEAVLLAQCGLRPGTSLDRLALRQAGAVSVQRRGDVFFKAATSPRLGRCWDVRRRT